PPLKAAVAASTPCRSCKKRHLREGCCRRGCLGSRRAEWYKTLSARTKLLSMDTSNGLGDVLRSGAIDRVFREASAKPAEHNRANSCDLLSESLFHYRSLNVGSQLDRKSTRLNSSHVAISYAVFCLKKKTKSTMRAN